MPYVAARAAKGTAEPVDLLDFCALTSDLVGLAEGGLRMTADAEPAGPPAAKRAQLN